MRDKLNESKAAQVGLVAVLALLAAVLILGKSGGSGSGAETEVAVEAGETLPVASQSGMGELPTSVPAGKPLPRRFTAAYEAGGTVALLVVHSGGIDDAYTRLALEEAARVARLAPSEIAPIAPAVIVVPAKRISRYASVTVGLNINQVPALIVMRPKRLSHGVPQATVSYGYQSAESIYVSLLDASYVGPEHQSYHPG